MENSGLQYKIGLDTKQLISDIDRAKSGFNSLTQEAVSQGESIQSAFDNVGQSIKNTIGNIAGISLGVAGIKSMISSIASTRSYFQDIESSMKVFLGSAEKASEFTSKLKDYAWYNMFEFSDLANASKQLIAYGNDVNNVIPIIDKLSNIAAGTGGDLQHFVDMFNRAKSTGQVGARDMYAWASAGVVLKDVMKDMGEEVAGTSLTFDQLNRALDHVTGDGGMFNNLMGEQMENLSSWWGALQDDMSTVLNDLGEKLQDPMTEAMKVAHNLLDNYEDVLQVLKEVAIAFGTVKTASVLEGVYGKLKDESLEQEVENIKELTKAYKEVLNEEQIAQVDKLGLTEGTREYNDALKIQLDQLVKNANLEKQLADESLNKIEDLISGRENELEAMKGLEQNAFSQLQSAKSTSDAIAVETAERNLEVATMNRQAAEGKLVSAQEQKEAAVRRQNTATIQKEIITKNADAVAEKASATSTNILTAAKTRLIDVFNKLKAAMLSNPFTAIAAAVTALAYGIYKLATYETQAEKAQRELNEALDDMDKEQRKENANLDIMFKRLRDAKEGTQEYANAKAAIQKEYGSYLENQVAEIKNLQDIEGAYKAIRKAVMETTREKQLAKVQDTVSTMKSDATTEFVDKTYEVFKKIAKERVKANGDKDLTRKEINEEAEKIASVLQEQLNTYIESGEEITGELLRVNREMIQTEINKNKLWNFYQKDIDRLNKIDPAKELAGELRTYLNQYNQALSDADRILDNATKRFGTTAKNVQEEVIEETYENLAKAYETAKNNYEIASKKVADMEANREKYNTKQYDDAVLEAKNAKELFEKLGGQLKKEEKKEEKKNDPVLQMLEDYRKQYDTMELFMNSTNESVKAHGESLYKELEGQGKNYLEFLLNLRNSAYDKMTDTQKIALDTAIANATRPEKQSETETQNPFEELRNQYATYTEEKAKIDLDYNKKLQIAIQEGNGERIKMVKDGYEKAMSELDSKFGKSLLKNSAPLAAAMEKASQQTKANLKESLKTLNALKKYKKTGDESALNGSGVSKEEADKLNLEELELVYQQLIEVQEEYDKKSNYPFRNLVEGFKALKKAKEAYDKGDSTERTQQEARAQQMFSQAVNTTASSFSTLGQMMQDIGESSGNAKIKELGETFAQVGQLIGSIASGFASGGVWGAAIAGLTSLVSMATQGASKVAQANAQMEQSYYAFAKAVRQANLEIDETKYENIFGTDQITKANEAIKSYNNAYKDYVEITTQKSGKSRQDISESFSRKGDSLFSTKGAHGKNGGSYTFRGSNGQNNRELTELEAITFRTKSYGWWDRRVNGKKNKYTTLADYKLDSGEGIFDEYGNLIVKNAKLFLKSTNYLNEAQKDLVQQAIDNAEAMEKANEILDDIASNVVGDMAKSIGDAIQDAVLNGADSFDAFEKAGAQAIKSLGDMLVQNLVLEGFMNEHQDAIKEGLKQGMKSGNYAAFNAEMKKMGEEWPNFYNNTTQAMTKFYEEAERGMGISLDSIRNIETATDTARTAQQKGIAQASQDSIDELNGRMTAVQGHTFSISQNSKILADNSANILRVVMGISNDTSRLANIEQKIVLMESHLSNINTRGVYTR